jgi:hypothetical protein
MYGKPIISGYTGHAMGSSMICINSKCPNYFEPALRQDIVKEPERGHGIKLDRGKPPVFTEFLMQFPRAIRLIAMVGDKGSKAPGHVRSGWQGVDDGYLRYSDAAARHLLDEAMLGSSSYVVEEGPDAPDPMRDLLWQAATVAWNDLARLEHLIKNNAEAAERLDPTREV